MVHALSHFFRGSKPTTALVIALMPAAMLGAG